MDGTYPTKQRCRDMWQLDHAPLCPFSRLVRLVLSEKRISYELNDRPLGDRRGLERFYQGPVLRNQQTTIAAVGSSAICEFLEEIEPKAPMLMGSALERAEVRRLVAYIEEDFYAGVTQPLAAIHPTLFVAPRGTKCPSLTSPKWLADHILCELDYLLDTRRWLAGATISLADFAAAAHIAVADYLGGIGWADHQQTREWYAVMKSRRSFAPFLVERVSDLEPPSHYADVDF